MASASTDKQGRSRTQPSSENRALGGGESRARQLAPWSCQHAAAAVGSRRRGSRRRGAEGGGCGGEGAKRECVMVVVVPRCPGAQVYASGDVSATARSTVYLHTVSVLPTLHTMH